jgi:hypothetical protein
MFIKAAGLFAVLLAVAGCQTVKPIIGPDGTTHQLVSCYSSIEGCYSKAREACGGNYKIINTSSSVSGDASSTSSSIDLLVKCDNQK